MTTKTEVEKLLEELMSVEDQMTALRLQRDEARERALTPSVKAELEAIDAELGTRLEHGESLIRSYREKIKAGVLDLAESVRAGRLLAVYANGKLTWDTKGLLGYAKAHKEVREFATEHDPTVSIRWVEGK
jgi:hypothetical protein